jgi:Fe2+ transport system protein B
MAENTLIGELAKFVGFPIILFIIWMYYHRATMRIFEKMLDAQFSTLKELIETNQCTVTLLARIEQKIDNNIFCPLVRERTRDSKETKKGEKDE